MAETAEPPGRLPDSAELLHLLADAARAIIWMTGPDLTLEYLSPNLAQCSGIPDASGRWDDLLACVHPHDREALRRSWDEARRKGTRLSLDARLGQRGGAYRWFRVEGRPVFRTAAGPFPLLGCATEVSERNGAGRGGSENPEKVHKQGLLGRERLAVLGLLAASIAHEINNPNNFIKLNLPALRDYLDALLPIVDEHVRTQTECTFFGMPYHEFREDLFRLVDNMEHGCDRITATVRYLREFIHRMQHGHTSNAELRGIVARAVNLSRAEVMRTVRSLEVEDPDAPVWVRTNPGALEIVLINLLLHASRAADKRDSWVRVKIAPVPRQEGAAVIEVADNGRRLSEGELRKLLDPPSPDLDSKEGAESGLYACMALMREVDGRLEVNTTQGDGSVFRILLNGSGV